MIYTIDCAAQKDLAIRDPEITGVVLINQDKSIFKITIQLWWKNILYKQNTTTQSSRAHENLYWNVTTICDGAFDKHTHAQKERKKGIVYYDIKPLLPL